jgi:transglutaminase-like putative cysteine protease
MKQLTVLIASLFPLLLFGQNYNVLLIPDSLKQNANAVKRYEELYVEIKSPSKAVVKHKWAITILNEAGEKYNGYYNSYDKMKPLVDVSGRLYDGYGKQIRSVRKKDMEDVAAYDGISLVSDDRIKKHEFYFKEYPFTVEYQEEQEYDGVFFLPQWTPVEGSYFAVEQSTFAVQGYSENSFRYKENNFSARPVINNGSYKWELKNSKSYLYEPLQPSWQEILPSIYIAPSDFEMGRYKGNMETWEDLGKFIARLNEGRDQLPDELKQKIQVVVQSATSIEEKVTLLYEFLQKNTRYISIQLGIGGFQPFDAGYVATKNYGDCKALSNYMVSILKVAGIPANYVLITAGKGEKGLWEDFPSPYFNHAIMCVPNGNDTIWLECTSQTKSAGYMGTFTGNRKALLINENGGVVVKTPTYTIADNLQIRKVNAIIDAQGNLSAEVRTRFTGEQQEDQHDLIHEYTSEQRQKYLNQVISLPTYNVEESDYKEKKGRIPVIDEYLKITAPNYATITGRRLFLQPNLFNKNGMQLNNDKSRLFPFELSFPYRDIDTVNITIPEGYSPEAIPKNVSISNQFGKYSIRFQVDGATIQMIRSREVQEGVYPATSYTDYVQINDAIYKADRSKIVLVKKE